MRVRAILIGQSIVVQPDPVQVLVGEPLYWEFISALPNMRIKWEVYFRHGNPFGSWVRSLIAETGFGPVEPVGPVGPINSPTHYGLSPSAIASTPDDYKYGVRAMDAITQETLGDDDPHLIILP